MYNSVKHLLLHRNLTQILYQVVTTIFHYLTAALLHSYFLHMKYSERLVVVVVIVIF